MDIVKMGGLAFSTVCSVAGYPSLSSACMLIEEIAKSNSELTETIKKVEVVVVEQVLSQLRKAKQALSNAQSDELDEEERLSEIRRAWFLLESCYHELSGIDFLSNHKAEVAFNIAMCHSLLGRRKFTEEWLTISFADYVAFSQSENPMSSTEKDDLKDIATFSSGTLIAGLAISAMVTGGLSLIPMVIAGTAAAGGIATAQKGIKRSDGFAKRSNQYKEQQNNAWRKSHEVKEVIKQFNPSFEG
jgi:hypothetical protein